VHEALLYRKKIRTKDDMQERKTNLDVLDPLGEKQGTCALSNGIDVGVDGANNADTSVSGERRLKHPG
jgi:hypothetical protein